MAAGMVIVGAGECGGRAALALRNEGYRGRITLIGAEPHLPYERPPLSKAMLHSAEPPRTIAGEEQFALADIDVLRGVTVAGIDRAQGEVVCDTAAVPYDKLLLATGARPRQLMTEGRLMLGIRYVRGLDDALLLRSELRPGRRLVVIGGGFLGLEIAAGARQRGLEVVVIETQARVLSRGVPAEIAGVIAARHEAAGVAIHTGLAIARIATGDGGGAVRMADGRVFDADVIVAAIGALPNAEIAADAGLAVNNGVRVDAGLATSDGNILAGGDCSAFPCPTLDGRLVRLESWRSAGDHAALAARNMLGAADRLTAPPWFWSDQYDLSLQVAGLYEPGLSSVKRPLGSEAFILFHLDGEGRLVAASGIGVGNAVARDIKLAEMLITRRAYPEPEQLAQPDVKLKALLAA